MDLTQFKDLLNTRYSWPCEYAFKFVIPQNKEQELLGLLPLSKLQKKPSAKGNFISITAQRSFNSADEVIQVYQKVSNIDGIIAL